MIIEVFNPSDEEEVENKEDTALNKLISKFITPYMSSDMLDDEYLKWYEELELYINTTYKLKGD